MATFAFRTMTDKRFHVTLLLGLAAFAGAAAAAESGGNLPILLAGEIILAPPKGDASPSSTEASRQRESAREHRKGQSAPAPAVIIVPEDDEGVLSPRRGSSNGAAENAARARAQRQGENGAGSAVPMIVLPETPAPSAESPAAQRAHSNRARAIEYRKGEQHSQAVVKGSDSLPVIDCSTVDNIAGRIGDDTRSGSVVILIQDRNQVKVRCR